jgi:hypothetical protein
MKNITKTAKLAFAAILLTFCLACEEKEAAKEANMQAKLAELATIEAATQAASEALVAQAAGEAAKAAEAMKIAEEMAAAGEIDRKSVV